METYGLEKYGITGIKEIVYQNPYPDELSQQLLAESGILVREYTGESGEN